jgi:cation diffusion facilitator CzcD-associated flavoprotein CzcO
MSDKLKSKPEVAKFIIPTTFNVGCRRPTPGNGYLEALASQKTTVLTSPIKSITENGILDAETGEEFQVDVIICATGFDTSYRPRFPVYGLDTKESLSERWAEFPSSYLGIGVDKFPNYFSYLGPFTPVAQGSLLPIITGLTNYVLQVIKKMRIQHIRRLSPKTQAVQDWKEHTQTYLTRSCWADPCTSWFKTKGDHGDIIMWPGSRLSFFEVMSQPNYEDYEMDGLRVQWNQGHHMVH